ncbi:hypothetical protein [Mycobacterium sp. E3198]|uniref:DUF7159 family protein n=1 Tax=Mycobacterium sp. E3198 TaxID=1834143 RepID=UPI0007FF1055|nr:hypothetical protein [Mycobacterium sp. E3198]OBG31746.1 hypothetical protein A5673_26290 [Mycobacterium sp. E3198]
MDIVLGVSLAPETVRMVLVEGAGAGGVTVDEANFAVAGVAAVDQVIGAILGTTESAVESGYQVRSSGVTWTDQTAAAALRKALAERKIENVVLVSAFVAAAALAQAVASATNCARTALLFVEPTAATLALVDTADGSIADVQRKPLPHRDDAALAELAAMVGAAESLRGRPDGIVLVGSGVDIPSLKPALEAATSLSVTVPEEPEMALARGAALAAAHQQLGAPSTVAMPYVEEPAPALAYSAEAAAPADDHRDDGERRSRKLLAVLGATAILVVGAAALALAIGIRPHAQQRPDIGKNVVAPATQAAPPPPQAPPPAPPAPSAPPPAPAPAAPQPGPSANPPAQWPPSLPRDDDHDDRWGWLRRHLGHGILGP